MSCSLVGSFSPEVQGRLRKLAPDVKISAEDHGFDRPRVAVVDRLADTDDAESVDMEAIHGLRDRKIPTVAIVSGTQLPALGPHVVTIGYQPSNVILPNENAHWGLAYAPVPPGIEKARQQIRDNSRALVALGGHPDFAPLKTVCTALAPVRSITTIDVLLSPAAGQAQPRNLPVSMSQTVKILSGVPDVLGLLAGAGLVVASFGNLVFEALATGAPTCVIGQKTFQTELAKRLAALGVCEAAGAAEPGREAAITKAVERTLARRVELSKRASAAVDGHGLERIADLIVEAANE